MRRMVEESVPSVGFVYILNDTAPIRWEAMCSLWVNGKILNFHLRDGPTLMQEPSYPLHYKLLYRGFLYQQFLQYLAVLIFQKSVDLS